MHRVIYWINYWCSLQVKESARLALQGAQGYWEELRMKCSRRGKDGSHGRRDYKLEAKR
jgi:hypothetical protein